jgi:hypothetical protein
MIRKFPFHDYAQTTKLKHNIRSMLPVYVCFKSAVTAKVEMRMASFAVPLWGHATTLIISRFSIALKVSSRTPRDCTEA